MRILMATVAAALCVPAANGCAQAAKSEASSDTALAIAEILFPPDQLALLATSGGKDWSAEVINGSNELSKFAGEHPEFRHLFRSKFEPLIADALAKEAGDFYTEVSRQINAHSSARGTEAALTFLRSAAGTKIVKFMHDSVSRGPRQSPVEVNINKLLTPTEQAAVDAFSRTSGSKIIMDAGQYDPATQRLIDRAFARAAPHMQKVVNEAVAQTLARGAK